MSKRAALWKAQGGLCFYCQTKMQRSGAETSKRLATIEHLTPRSDGGRAVVGNVVLACRSCNGHRGTRELTQDEMKRAEGLTREVLLLMGRDPGPAADAPYFA